MPHNPILSPTHEDNDVLILDGVIAGVHEQGARYGLSAPRRELLIRVLELTRLSMVLGCEDAVLRGLSELLATGLFVPQTGRPSHPHRSDGGDPHVSDPLARLPRRAGTD